MMKSPEKVPPMITPWMPNLATIRPGFGDGRKIAAVPPNKRPKSPE